MAILLYNHYGIEERAAKHLKFWKSWHLVLFSLTAVSSLANFILLQNTMQAVDNNCVLYPKELQFREVELPDTVETTISNETNNTGNHTTILMVDTQRSLYGPSTKCDFATFMPVISLITAIMWLTMFTMCAGGGRVRTGLQEPWRILTPALIFSLIMVVPIGYSFAATDGGLRAFCQAFSNVTNDTTCSSVNPHIESTWNSTWSFSARAESTRAAAAAMLASWACATALMLARCLAAPDFVVKRIAVHLESDPLNKVTPYLKKSRPRSAPSSQSRRDTASIRSDPTITTELVTATLEHTQDSGPSSLMTTPAKRWDSDNIEMTYTPQNNFELHIKDK